MKCKGIFKLDKGGLVYHGSGSLVKVDVEVLVELFHTLLLQPFFSIGKLAHGTFDIELAGSEVTPGSEISRVVLIAAV